jgi:DNA-binding Xre family transcriptional regulator
MNLQVIKSVQGHPEYVLLPISVYHTMQDDIAEKLKTLQITKSNYVDFVLEDFVDNPIALARIKAKLTQKELADRLGVSQAYISKLESQTAISAKTLNNVMQVLKDN